MRTVDVKAAIAALLAAFSVLASAAEPVAVQSRERFEAAIHNRTTSPSYVLISVIDGKTGAKSTYCTPAPFLLGAIHMEHGLSYTREDQAKAMDIALKSEDHVYRFEQQAALDNVRARYTPDDFAAARVALASSSTDELKGGFRALSFNPSLGRLPKDAVACVLIERGLSAGIADRSGQIYVGH